MVVSTEAQREQISKLIEEKTAIEKKIASYGDVLHKNNVSFHEALVDSDGFPRADIDVRSVRLARTQILCLQNDLKELIKSIEAGLEKYFKESQETLTSTKISPDAAAASNSTFTGSSTPFVVVNLVSPNSPAADAGIQIRDQIVSFGSISSNSFVDLVQIGKLVKNSQNQQVRVKVKRENNLLELILVPKIWSGRGLLGCNIVPIA